MEFTQPSPEILAQQKQYKASKESFKAAIADLSMKQSRLKQERKTVFFPASLTRSMEPGMAQKTHLLNRYDLKHLHIAYSRWRTESGTGYNKLSALNFEYDNEYVNRLIAQHGSKIVHLNKV